jgi:hypothetical protein
MIFRLYYLRSVDSGARNESCQPMILWFFNISPSAGLERCLYLQAATGTVQCSINEKDSYHGGTDRHSLSD